VVSPGEAEAVETRVDFIKFVRALSAEDSAGWENPTTSHFLESLAAWVEDTDLVPEPSWRSFAMILNAATFYE
jgi:hypothetical protein